MRSIQPDKPTVSITVPEDVFKAILECFEYTATHKYKKDPIAQAILADYADFIEYDSEYLPPLQNIVKSAIKNNNDIWENI